MCALPHGFSVAWSRLMEALGDCLTPDHLAAPPYPCQVRSDTTQMGEDNVRTEEARHHRQRL